MTESTSKLRDCKPSIYRTACLIEVLEKKWQAGCCEPMFPPESVHCRFRLLPARLQEIRSRFTLLVEVMVAKLVLNQDNTKVKTLIDWGADQPCINKRVADNIAHSSRIPTGPYSVTMPQESLKKHIHIHILQISFVDCLRLSIRNRLLSLR